MKASKNTKIGQQNNTIQSKAKNQAHEGSILQAYKKGTAQLQSDEEEPVQGKFETAQLASEDEEEPAQRQENKTGLPDNLKSGVENLSGHSLDDVKVHYNSSQPASLQAHAYAQGSDIHVAPGQEKHLPHEAWHVAQQKQGRVQPTKQLKGKTNINDDAGLEKEADVMGAKAMQLKTDSNTTLLQDKSANTNTAQLETTIDYGNLTDFKFNDGQNVDVTEKVGTSMSAHLDPADEKTGTDTSGSNAFDELFRALQNNTASTWVRGHLLNHDLGGVAHYNNLFPITTAANGEHYHEVEKIVKHWIGKKCEVDYDVTATKTGNDANPEGTFNCVAKVTDDPSTAQTFAGKQINKTIHSKATKVVGVHNFANGSTKPTNKFAKVVPNLGNNTSRDSYKGSLSKNSKWNHATGNASKNNKFLINNESFPGKETAVYEDVDMDGVELEYQTHWAVFFQSYTIDGPKIDGDFANEIIGNAQAEANDQEEFDQIIIDDLEDEGYIVTKK
jgi:hypothetical protein